MSDASSPSSEPAAPRRAPVRVVRSDPPAAAVRALEALAASPHAVFVAGMADLHLGHEVCVGTVFATEHHVLPALLGTDLGCGVTAQRFDLPAASLSRGALRAVLDELAEGIPCGEAQHRAGQGPPLPEALREPALATRALRRWYAALGPRHFATLGGGNHYVELDRDAAGALWAQVHSGSRGLGAALGAHHRKAAGGGLLDALDARAPDGPGARCLADLAVASAFARASRAAMLAVVAAALERVVGARPSEASVDDPRPARIDTEHNFAQREEHGGRSLLVHRKGAARADEGALGLLPGSMGTATYVLRGRGAAATLRSCAHGAGRVLSRGEAHRTLDARAVRRSLGRVELRAARVEALLEEAPQAYRDVRAVLDEQRELVEPVLRLEPLAVLKG